ncbi:ATP-dependent nuclease [Kitasatospora purpeofusca]|uniref:ATP-dependent nuclease n=1 Tax=Kitasatospora purpeofusca TaxID=67352 RepID=UPI0038089791
MLFTQLPVHGKPNMTDRGAFLVNDMWDDYSFKTSFHLWCFNGTQQIEIGFFRIATFGMEHGRVDVPVSFRELDSTYFSLGADESYYATLRDKFDVGTRQAILTALQDTAYNLELFEQAADEQVMQESLLRGTEAETVRGQFHRIATGGPTRTKFDIRYRQKSPTEGGPSVILDLMVDPKTKPPSNIHALIGSNGVGKTRLLDALSRTVLSRHGSLEESQLEDRGEHRQHPFANLVSVSFSAFDPQAPLTASKSVGYQYVGLKYFGTMNVKDHSVLGDEFAESVNACLSDGSMRAERWLHVLERLESTDPIFHDHEISRLANQEEPRPDPKALFAQLSSGHKIVLLTLARLVEHTTERTLVLIDEPEAHLHPPLLSTFIRVLSELLADRNGIALIATHSPVVLQETPRRAVWALRRAGEDVRVDHPEIETFGENVGVITREIFALEVTRTGFHAMIEDLADQGLSFDGILAAFGDNLGAEGRALARAAARRQGNVG